MIDSAIADFYIPVAIDEEIQQARIERFLPSSSLLQHQTKTPLRTNRDGTYDISVDWFDTDCDRLLLTLSCTQPEPISTPQSDSNRVASVINLGQWFRQQIDDLTQELAWTLFPTWQIAGAMRGETPFRDTGFRDTGAEGFLAILKALAQQGTHFSPELRAGYQTVQLGEQTLQLCILVAPLTAPGNPPEWSLMAILKPQDGGYLPAGIRLQIADQGTMLVEQGTQPHSRAGSLHVQAIGDHQETLTVTILQTSAEGSEQAIAQFPFQFEEG